MAGLEYVDNMTTKKDLYPLRTSNVVFTIADFSFWHIFSSSNSSSFLC